MEGTELVSAPRATPACTLSRSWGLETPFCRQESEPGDRRRGESARRRVGRGASPMPDCPPEMQATRTENVPPVG